jgi:hypothetical protein
MRSKSQQHQPRRSLALKMPFRILTAPAAVGAACLAISALGTSAAQADAVPGAQCDPTVLAMPAAAAPSGFNPVTATASQLAQYGFPARPTDPVALLVWQNAMAHATTLIDPPSQCSTVVHDTAPPDHSVNNTSNYAGHVMANSYENNATFTGSSADWTQPSVPSAAGYPNYQSAPDASFWDGIGYSTIIQDGCDSISTSNSPTYKCWTEDYPDGTDWEGPAVRPGDEVYSSVHYNGNQTSTYFIEDVTTGKYLDKTHPSTHVGFRAGDFINEELGPYLPNYGRTTFNGCETSTGADTYPLQSNNNNVDNNTSSPGATPSSVNNSNSSFSVSWNS